MDGLPFRNILFKAKLVFIAAVFLFVFAGCDDKEGDPAPTAEVGNMNDLQNAVNHGILDITMTAPLSGDAAFYISKLYNEGDVLKINIPMGGNSLSISQAGQMGKLYPYIVINAGDAGDVTVNTPGCGVELTGHVAGTLTSFTGMNNLVITQNSSVAKLSLRQGAAIIDGTVAEFTHVASNALVIWTARTAAQLRSVLQDKGPLNNDGVLLMADITDQFADAATDTGSNGDLFHIGVQGRDDYSTTGYDGYILDGNGCSISGTAHKNLLGVYADSVIIQNLVLMQTPAQKAVQNNNGMGVYRSTGLNLYNVAAVDCGTAGIEINASTATATYLATSGNGTGGVCVTSDGTEASPAEIPDFTLASGTLTDTRPVYVDYRLVPTGGYRVNVPSQWTSGEDNDGNLVYYPPAGTE